MTGWNYFIQNIQRDEDMMFRSKKRYLKHHMDKCDPVFFVFWDVSFGRYSLVSMPKSEASA